MKKLISIITPCYNEEANLRWYYNQVTNAIKQLEEKYDFEIVITDNCSEDSSFEIIKELAEKDKRVRGFRFSRNFGFQASILTGYRQSKGNAVIEYDCDLQDPLELLPEFLNKWEEGNKIIYGIRKKRAEGFVITGLRKIFYKLINKISDYELPEGAGDFMLLDRSVVDRLCRLKNKNPYLRGVIFGYGFKRVGVPYARNARLYGTSKFSASKLVRLAMDGIVSQSTFPLRLASLFGFVVAFVTFLISIYFLLAKLFWASSLPAGFTAIILVILFGVAFNAIFLGIVGEYLGRIYSQITQNEELTIIEEKTE